MGWVLHNLKTLILKMIVVLWIPNSLTSLASFSFSLNPLKTCPWWYATFIIPLFFVLIISSYRLIISAAFRGLVFFQHLYLVHQILQFHLLSSKRFAFLLSVIPFHIYKQKNKYFSTKSKTINIYLSYLFAFKLIKDYLICSYPLFFVLFF